MVQQVFKVVYGAGAGQISEVAPLSAGLSSHWGMFEVCDRVVKLKKQSGS